MLGFDDYKSGTKAATLGEQRKVQSDMIIEASWYGDIATKKMYFFDYEHDPEPKKFKDLDMWKYKKLPSMDCKYLQGSYQSLDKDEVALKLQMKPSQECVVPYYKEVFEDRYDATYPVGLYCIIPNEKGVYEKWLVCAVADNKALQFPTYHILPCDYLLTWIYNNKKQYMLGCLRSQNSYIVVRFIKETLCRKLSNCWEALRALIPKQRNEIRSNGNGLKSLRIG